MRRHLPHRLPPHPPSGGTRIEIGMRPSSSWLGLRNEKGFRTTVQKPSPAGTGNCASFIARPTTNMLARLPLAGYSCGPVSLAAGHLRLRRPEPWPPVPWIACFERPAPAMWRASGENRHMERQLLSGDEAVALAARDAGVALGTGYPGTPSTEILETFSELGGRASGRQREGGPRGGLARRSRTRERS